MNHDPNGINQLEPQSKPIIPSPFANSHNLIFQWRQFTQAETELMPIEASPDEQEQMSSFLRQYPAARAMRGIGSSMERVSEILKQVVPTLDPSIAWWTAYVGITFVDRMVQRLADEYVRISLNDIPQGERITVRCPKRGETSVVEVSKDPRAALMLETVDDGVYVTLEGDMSVLRVYRHDILLAKVGTGKRILVWPSETLVVGQTTIKLRAGTPSQQVAFAAPRGPLPDELPVRLTQPQIWALSEAIDFFEKDLLPDFRGKHGYLFADVADARRMICVLRGLMKRHEWIRRWDGYFRLQAQLSPPGDTDPEV